MSIEYRIEKVKWLMSEKELHNEWGIYNWELISIVEVDEELWYHFKRV